MKAARMASHLACIVAGAFLAASWSSASSNGPSAHARNGGPAGAHELPAKTAARAAQSSTHPRELLERAARMPMESGHRQTLKEQLLKEWGERDPQGLLAWLKDRPWNLTNRRSIFDGRDDTLGSLARKDPQGLLRYAREAGSSAALSAWLKSGLPAETLRRIASGEVGALPDWVTDEIFEFGCEIDPRFHEQLRSVAEGSARSDAAMTIADSFLNSRRFGEFVEWLGKDGDLIPMQKVGERLGRELAHPAFDLVLFGTLPEAARAGAADGLFKALNGSDDPFSSSFRTGVEPEQLLKLLSLLQGQHLLGQGDEQASRAIEKIFQPLAMPGGDPFGGGADGDPAEIAETNRSRAMSLIEWADALPAGAESMQLRTAAWKSAIAMDPSATQAGIDGITDSKLRDFCHAWAAYHLEGEAAQASLDKIADADVRGQLQRYREWKESSEPDPFGGYDGPLPWNE